MRSAPGSRRASPARDEAQQDLHLPRPSARVHHREMEESREEMAALHAQIEMLTELGEAQLARAAVPPSPMPATPFHPGASATLEAQEARSEEIVEAMGERFASIQQELGSTRASQQHHCHHHCHHHTPTPLLLKDSPPPRRAASVISKPRTPNQQPRWWPS